MDGNRFLDNLKDDFRRGALAQRDALSVEARTDAARVIAATSLPVELPRGVIVAGYSPINSELDPFPLMRALADRGAVLALPVIIARDHALIFREWQPEEGLVRGPYGIFQPSSDAPDVDPDIVLCRWRHSTAPVTALGTAGAITTARWKISAPSRKLPLSVLLLQCRKSRPCRDFRTTSNSIVC